MALLIFIVKVLLLMLLQAFRRVNKTFLLLLQKCSHAHTYTQTERKIKTVESSVRDFYRFRNRFYGNNVRFYKVFTLNIGTITKPKLNQTNGCSHTSTHRLKNLFNLHHCQSAKRSVSVVPPFFTSTLLLTLLLPLSCAVGFEWWNT